MDFELLAPAGSLDKLKFAFKYGADAVYLGIPDFSLRARLNDFNLDSVKESINYAHSIGKKVYVTFNIFAHNQHIRRFEELKDQFIEFFNGSSKPDAVIVSDPGLMLCIKEIAPNMDLHVSTQANTLNYKAVEFWIKNGASRIIFGREASLNDIKDIRKYFPNVELECFVHGAQCMAYSGRCFLSRYFTGSSANLGACVQPCRFGYSMKEEKTINIDTKEPADATSYAEASDVKKAMASEREVTLIEDEHGTYFFNSHDLCMIEYIDQLMDAGVNSFKVEGRTKSIFYIGMAMKAYRNCIDLLVQGDVDDFKNESKYWKGELEKLVNRGYSSCFMFGEAIKDPSCESNSHLACDYRFVGEIVDDGTVFVHNKIIVGDIVEIIPIKGENYSAKISKIINPRNNEELQEFSAGNDKSYVKLVFDKDINLEPMTLIMKDYKN